MKRIDDLLKEVAGLPGCSVSPASGLPKVRPGHVLTDELVSFYSRCGGVMLFGDASYSLEIVAPSGFVPSTPLVLGEALEGELCASWYVLAKGPGSGDLVVVDLHPERAGRIIDGFWDRYANQGDSDIIAYGVLELIERSLPLQGDHWYWCQPGFQKLGDAYDP